MGVLVVGEPGADSDDGGREQAGRIRFYKGGESSMSTEVAAMSGEFEVGRFGGVVVEAAGGSGLLVGAPYAGLGLANLGKVYFFNSSTEFPGGDIGTLSREVGKCRVDSARG